MENANKNINILEHVMVLIIICFIGLVASHFFQFVSANGELGFFQRLSNAPKTLLPGMLSNLIGMIIIYVICIIGLIISKKVPFYLPSIAWISLVAIVSTSPISPIGGWVMAQTADIGILPLATPILAYAGFAIAEKEISVFKRSGFKLFIVGVLVFIGTYVGSAIVANYMLKFTGV